MVQFNSSCCTSLHPTQHTSQACNPIVINISLMPRSWNHNKVRGLILIAGCGFDLDRNLWSVESFQVTSGGCSVRVLLGFVFGEWKHQNWNDRKCVFPQRFLEATWSCGAGMVSTVSIPWHHNVLFWGWRRHTLNLAVNCPSFISFTNSCLINVDLLLSWDQSLLCYESLTQPFYLCEDNE